MPPLRPRSSGRPSAPRSPLERLALGLCQVGAEAGLAAVVGVVAERDEFELWWRDAAEAPDPVRVLEGFVAPADWWAAGVVAAAQVSVGAGAPRAATIAFLTSREGEAAAAYAAAGGDGRLLDAEAPLGWVVDVCRRALGLPTDPPPAPVSAWLLELWLDRVASAAAAGPLGWAGAAALHPLAAVGAPTGPGLVAAWRRERRGLDWEAVLGCLREGPSPPAELAEAAPLAAWMDAGMLARKAFAALRPEAEVGRQLAEHVDGAVLAEVIRVVDVCRRLDAERGR